MGSMENKQDVEACLYAQQLASFSVLPMTLKAAIELGVLEVVVKAGPGRFLSPQEIAEELGIKNPDAPAMLDRMLRALASYEIFTYDLETTGEDGTVARRYGAAPVCKYLTKNEDGVSYDAVFQLFHDRVLMECWYYLKDAVLEGGTPFNKAHGIMLFEYLGKDLRFNKIFNAAMANHSTFIMKNILEAYTGFQGLHTIVDVGGGVGATLNMIISKYPSIKGINFDLPHVIAVAPEKKEIEHVGGNMFECVPSGGDAIFMKWILHDWSDKHCIKLLKNCWKALPTNGKVIIAEGILPVVPETGAAAKYVLHSDMIMLAQCLGGRERTEKEFELLARKTGFSGFKVVCNACFAYIMEFSK